MEYEELEDIMKEAIEGLIYCRDCGNTLEPDNPECSCGWKNPIVEMGMI